MKFENVYVEDEIKNLDKTKNILKRIKYKNIIICDKYSEIFNPKNQNFRIQKINPSIILAKNFYSHNELSEWDKEIRNEVSKAAEDAKSDVLPDNSELFTDVYMENNY